MTDHWTPPEYAPVDLAPIIRGEPHVEPAVKYRDHPFGSYGDREPVRMPVWAAIGGSQVFGLAIDLLTSVPWRSAAAGMLVTLGPLLFGAELARQRAWSPLSALQAAKQARDDERQTLAAGHAPDRDTPTPAS